MKRFYSLISIVFALSVTTSGWGQLKLDDSTEQIQITDWSHFRSSDTQAGVSEAETFAFEPVDANRPPSFGFDPHAAHWFKFSVSNQSTQSHWLLEVGYPPLDWLELYMKDSAGHWNLQTGGDHYTLGSRKYKNRNVIFDLELAPQQSATVYLKVVTKSSIQVPLKIWKAERLTVFNYEEQFMHGIFYGIMLIMVFYNLFLYLSIKDKTTLYYIFTLLSGTNVIAFFQGYGYYYLYPQHPELGPYFSALSSPLFIVSSVALTRSFLSLSTFSFDLDRILVATGIVSVLAGITILISDGYFTYSSLHLLTTIDFVLILVSATYCFRKKYRPARFFLLAWTSLLLVGVLFSLRNLGIIQSNWFANNALYFGGIMQTLLISFALGDRINMLKRENEEARQRELEREQLAKEKLEQEVTARTEEISQQKDQLEASNSVKDKLFSIISHDLKGPLNSLKGTLTIWQMGALNPDELKKMTHEIGDQLQQTSDLLDNLLQWSKSQLEGEVIRPEKVAMHDLLTSSTELLASEFKKKGIAFSIRVDEPCAAIADPNMIRTVVRNLVSNALKFTPSGGSVIVSAAPKGQQVLVTVEDSGVGIPQQSLQSIFSLQGVTTSGTREEKGTGIGLVLCKEFVERNGGSIRVESTEGKGSIFSFTLPQAMQVASKNVLV